VVISSLVGMAAVFGLLPGLLLRAIVLFYPKGHPRREELFNELYDPEMGRMERIEWVFQQLELASRQGLTLRRCLRAERRAERKASKKKRISPELQERVAWAMGDSEPPPVKYEATLLQWAKEADERAAGVEPAPSDWKSDVSPSTLGTHEQGFPRWSWFGDS
jgi:hypothetical protein